ncbi:Maf family protein [Kocuria sp. M1R5S2]|uniref:Maf family protein n=1 Tax=Kocuria rhizosphaerae TaxID=3376285 RepID=UPI0037880EBA
MTPRLVLASRSPARTKLLSDAGIGHDRLVSAVDEDAVVREHGTTGAEETAMLLARAKAEAVAALPEAQDALVIGCDSVFELGGEVHGKPLDAATATARIRAMRGRSGVLHTGHWLVDTRDPAAGGTGFSGGAPAAAEVFFAQMSDDEVAAYVATGEPLEVAGSFTIDSRGAAFVERVEGDVHAVVGLSLSTLRTLLARTGVGIHQLWSPPQRTAAGPL